MATSYFINKTSVAADTNGGTSLAVRSSGADGIVNATAGQTKITSITASWSAGDVGHGIASASGSKFRLISAFTAGGTFTATSASTSTALTSSGAFSSGMVGQAITGPGLAANTVITVFTDSSHVTISIAAGAGFGTGTFTIYPMLTTTGNVTFNAAVSQNWVVGGPWATIGATALTTNSPCAGGDTVYVGPGIYREIITAGLTSPSGSALTFQADVTGANNGVPGGEVRLTGSLIDFANVIATPLTITGKNWLTFANFVIIGGTAAVGTLTGTNITFNDCAIISSSNGGAIASTTFVVDVAANITFDRCLIVNGGNTTFTLPTSTVADYDIVFLFRNCVLHQLYTNNGQYTISGSGANTFKGGGFRVRSCTVIGGSPLFATGSATVSTTIPCTFYDNLFHSPGLQVFTANTAGQIIEDYNLRTGTTADTNVTVGTHSQTPNAISQFPFTWGTEFTWGGPSRSLYTPLELSLAPGFGTFTSPPSVDMFNRNRPSGVGRYITSGTASAGAATTLTDTANHFGAGAILQGAVVRLTGGTGSGQAKIIKSHTDQVLTLYGNWATTPDATSTYVIYFGNVTDSGIATSGSVTTLVQSSASWVVNMWRGFTVEITAGTGVGEITTITSNTATTLTIPTLGTAPDATSKFKIYRQTSETAVLNTAGAVERHDLAVKETTYVDAGTVGWALPGYQDQELYIPVDATSTTITIRCRYDTDHGTATKPQATLVADAELGVSTSTATASASTDTWETLTLGAFTPTASGFVVVRLQARSTKPNGRAFFDTVTVT